MTGRGKLALLGGILVAGLSPSFVDWKQSPEFHHEMLAYYAIAASLVVFGLWDGVSL